MARYAPRLITIPVAALCLSYCGGPEKKIEEKLAANVLFFANFDDRSRFEAFTKKKGTVAAMETSSPPRHEFTGGKEDGFVSFANGATYLSYQAKGNFPYNAGNSWSGGVSFWLSVDPNNDFQEKFPEPFSIGKKWDDAVIFVDFDKSRKDRPPSALRFGCYPDKTQKVGEELVRKVDDQVRQAQLEVRPMAPRCSHLVQCQQSKLRCRIRTLRRTARKSVGRRISDATLPGTWMNLAIRLNNYAYPGKIDEVAIFNTMLDPADVIYLYKPKRPLKVSFLRKTDKRTSARPVSPDSPLNSLFCIQDGPFQRAANAGMRFLQPRLYRPNSAGFL